MNQIRVSFNIPMLLSFMLSCFSYIPLIPELPINIVRNDHTKEPRNLTLKLQGRNSSKLHSRQCLEMNGFLLPISTILI